MTTKNGAKRQQAVLDKSFAQGSKRQLASLVDQYEIVVTSSFFYESFSEVQKNRGRVFGKLPEFVYIDTSALCRFELEQHKPATPDFSEILYINPSIVDGSRNLTGDEASIVTDFESEIIAPQVDFWQKVQCIGVPGFSAEEIGAAMHDVKQTKLLCLRIRDVGFIRQIAKELGVGFADHLDETWILFRRIQAYLINGVILCCLCSDRNFPRSAKNLEHDIHDIDYLCLALHVGAFATNESPTDPMKLGWKFKFLLPQGRLLQVRIENAIERLIIL
jgi:hypothetical protein